MDPTISRCFQGGRGELGLALSPSGERQELSAGRRKHSQGDSGVGEGFPSSPVEIPWAPQAGGGHRNRFLL